MHAEPLPLRQDQPREVRAANRPWRSIGRAALAALAGRRPHIGRRLTVLLVAIAVPALASPEQWPDFAIGNAGKADVPVQPMPFEKAGYSFPGSAFYFLDPQTELGEGIHSDADDATLAPDPGTGPAARSLRVRPGAEFARALECLTTAIYYEAASEPDAGQRAVAQVILNRVAHPSYPGTVCGVVYDGSARTTGCQFSFTCDGSLARKPMRLFWLRAQAIAAEALAGHVYSPVGLATHYHTVAVHPAWADKLIHLGTIGAHRFYRFGGRAGEAATFRFTHLGGEPVPGPHPRKGTGDSAADPLVIQQTFASAATSAPAPGSMRQTAVGEASAPAPRYTQEIRQRGGDEQFHGAALPQTTGIRPEYANSGRWIASPGV